MSQSDLCNVIKILAPVMIFLLLGAFLHMPYWYYRLLRIVVFVGAGLSGYTYYVSHSSREKYVSYIFYFTAFIYNPLVPLYFPKSVWEVINILTIAGLIFLYGVMRLYKKD